MPYGGGGSDGADASSVSNAVVNGDCQINQLNAVNTNSLFSFGLVNASYNNTDNVFISGDTSGNGAFNDSQRADHPILGSNGFCKSVETTVAKTVLAARFALVGTAIEGYLLRPFTGLSAILTFWAKSPKTGIHCVAFSNMVDRSFVAEYVVSAANVWQQHQIGLIFNAVGGTWDYTNGLGLKILFPLLAGSTFQTTPYAWNNGIFYATANQQNLMDTIGNTFRVTDIVLRQGIIAGAYPRVPFNEALVQCQRYYAQSFDYGTTPASGIAANAIAYNNAIIPFADESVINREKVKRPDAITPFFEFPVTMRATPTMVIYDPVDGSLSFFDQINTGGISSGSLSDTMRVSVSGLTNETGFSIAPITSVPNYMSYRVFDSAKSSLHYTANARL